jgi:hypothetical protein
MSDLVETILQNILSAHRSRVDLRRRRDKLRAAALVNRHRSPPSEQGMEKREYTCGDILHTVEHRWEKIKTKPDIEEISDKKSLSEK